MAKLKQVRALKSSGVEPLAPTLIKRQAVAAYLSAMAMAPRPAKLQRGGPEIENKLRGFDSARTAEILRSLRRRSARPDSRC
jgi:hypothetical protein